MSLTADQEKLKQSFLASGEQWTQSWQNILTLDQAYFSAYLKLRQVPTNKKHLPPKLQELILLSIDASCTHLFRPGVEAHTAAALAAGATKEEIMEVLEMTSVLGVHAVNVGVPLLTQVLQEDSMQSSTAPPAFNAEQERLKDSFIAQRGYWHGSWDPVLALSPAFFEAYTAFSSVPFQPGHSVLSPKEKELIYVAIDCATTHLYVVGLKLHIRNAIRHGATPEEVMETFELAALMGVHTVQLGADVLTEELKKREG